MIKVCMCVVVVIIEVCMCVYQVSCLVYIAKTLAHVKFICVCVYVSSEEEKTNLMKLMASLVNHQCAVLVVGECNKALVAVKANFLWGLI